MRRIAFQFIPAICAMLGAFSMTAARLWARDAAHADAQTPPAQADNPASPPANANADPEAMLPHFKDTRFWLSGQTNFIFQTHPDFHAAYSGQNSLSSHYEKATSRVMTLYTGVRLNNSTEVIVDIEEAGGAAQHRTWPGREYGSGHCAQSSVEQGTVPRARHDSQSFRAEQG
jgi:hypothetical protein